METRRAIHESETFKMVCGFLAVLVIGFGTAAAAIKFPDVDAPNPAMKPLAHAPALQLQNSAFGADDEDCVWVATRTQLPNGKSKLVRRLECAE